MASPVFVNTGTLGSVAGGTTVASTLPASRTNGNLLIAWVAITSAGVSVSWSSGWTAGDVLIGAGFGVAWAYRYVDGTEANPSATWTGSRNALANVHQYSGVFASAPIGATGQNSGNSTTITCPAITAQRAASTVLALLFVGTNQSIPTPSGYTTRYNVNGTLGAARVGDQTIASAGTASTAISSTISSTPWGTVTFEICSVAPPTGKPGIGTLMGIG